MGMLWYQGFALSKRYDHRPTLSLRCQKVLKPKKWGLTIRYHKNSWENHFFNIVKCRFHKSSKNDFSPCTQARYYPLGRCESAPVRFHTTSVSVDTCANLWFVCDSYARGCCRSHTLPVPIKILRVRKGFNLECAPARAHWSRLIDVDKWENYRFLAHELQDLQGTCRYWGAVPEIKKAPETGSLMNAR